MNKATAEAMLLIASILRLGESPALPTPLDDDSRLRMMQCLQVLAKPDPELVQVRGGRGRRGQGERGEIGGLLRWGDWVWLGSSPHSITGSALRPRPRSRPRTPATRSSSVRPVPPLRSGSKTSAPASPPSLPPRPRPLSDLDPGLPRLVHRPHAGQGHAGGR